MSRHGNLQRKTEHAVIPVVAKGLHLGELLESVGANGKTDEVYFSNGVTTL